MRIIRRSEWGFNGWSATPYHVNERADRIEFFIHYHGGDSVVGRTGVDVPRGIHKYHRALGWRGIGYGHVITAPGTIYEGRGFDLVGSHCSGHNRTGYSVQIHIGGNDRPTLAQLQAARWLYEEARRRSGRYLIKRGHRDGFATHCPGDRLYEWVRSGFALSSTYGSGGGITTTGTGGTASGGTAFQEEDVELTDSIPLRTIEKEVWDLDELTVAEALKSAHYARRFAYESKRDSASALEVVRALAAKGSPLTAAEIEKATTRGATRALSESGELDAIAAAIANVAPGATADEIVDAFVRRLADTTP